MHDLADSQRPATADHAPLYRLEAEVLRHPQVDMPVTHDFCAGLYARTMHIPAGTVATGAVHAEECFMVVRSGALRMSSGVKSFDLAAGDLVKSAPGTKRAVVTYADTVLTTFHANPTNETDPAALWSLFTLPAPALDFDAPLGVTQ